MRFNVGDKVVCIEQDKYAITNIGVSCEVIKVIPENENDYDDLEVRRVGINERWIVGSKYFALVEESRRSNLNLI